MIQCLLDVTANVAEDETSEGSVFRRKSVAEKSLLGRLGVFDISIPDEKEVTPFFNPGFVRGGNGLFFGRQIRVDVS